MLIPFDQVCLNRHENWNLVTAHPGWLNMYSRQACDQYDFKGPKTDVSRGWLSAVVCGGRQKITTFFSAAVWISSNLKWEEGPSTRRSRGLPGTACLRKCEENHLANKSWSILPESDIPYNVSGNSFQRSLPWVVWLARWHFHKQEWKFELCFRMIAVELSSFPFELLFWAFCPPTASQPRRSCKSGMAYPTNHASKGLLSRVQSSR